ncbi:hypothetical protein [Hoeflea poritis]|uniref:HEAT repeat domain-containing protein n=1 Tax=Hoeflea poritis TaxID=2993659 RepID=A0ABT4VST7_9HYPH|nr:hypothetical protein [Hoeflea poritis]MDA4847765.1 hypothetical protein [Hoeflea poritis]
MTAQILRDRLKEGDRRVAGAAGAVADLVKGDPELLGALIGLLDDEDAAVVAHTSHALMQIAQDRSSLFDPFADALLDRLEQLRQWEIGEQLPKILVCLPLTDQQADKLCEILSANIQNRSNIVAACSLQGIVDLARDGRIESARARGVLDEALRSDRKALSARARRLQKQLPS